MCSIMTFLKIISVTQSFNNATCLFEVPFLKMDPSTIWIPRGRFLLKKKYYEGL